MADLSTFEGRCEYIRQCEENMARCKMEMELQRIKQQSIEDIYRFFWMSYEYQLQAMVYMAFNPNCFRPRDAGDVSGK